MSRTWEFSMPHSPHRRKKLQPQLTSRWPWWSKAYEEHGSRRTEWCIVELPQRDGKVNACEREPFPQTPTQAQTKVMKWLCQKLTCDPLAIQGALTTHQWTAIHEFLNLDSGWKKKLRSRLALCHFFLDTEQGETETYSLTEGISNIAIFNIDMNRRTFSMYHKAIWGVRGHQFDLSHKVICKSYEDL